MKHRVDVHILHLPTENKQWANECVQSLMNEPVNVFHLDGVIGDVRQGRYLGYQQGNSPYVSFIDPDDVVYPGTFQKCIDVLDANPDCCGVYTISDIEFEDGQKRLIHPYHNWTPMVQYTNILEIHQIVVMRREFVLICYNEHYDDMPLTAYHEVYSFLRLATYKPWVAVDYVGYMWRKRNTGCHATEGKDGLPPSVKKLRNEFKTLYNLT